MNIPSNLKYTESNEWIEVNGNIGTIGISDFAQDQLSDIVFTEIIVAEGDEVKKGDTIATVESVKAAADIYAPASGKVTAVSETLASTPEVINSDPYGAAWMIKIELSKPDELNELMDAGAYETFSASQH
jgi:glycine cleavage system H protein